jgi:hypothetical protein
MLLHFSIWVFGLLFKIHPLLASIAGILAEKPPTDQTGISDAFNNLARMAAGLIIGIYALILVAEGYQYITSDETTRGIHLKRSLGRILGGGILVIFAVTVAPQILNMMLFGSPGGDIGTGNSF